MHKEKTFYPILITLLIVGIAGIPTIRYGIYAAPVVGIAIMLISGRISMRLTRPLFPFVLLLVVITFSAYKADYHWAKQTYFVLAYTSIFLFFDFSKYSPDIRKLNAIFVSVFVLQGLFSGGLASFSTGEISLLQSKSALESTLAFPIGLFAVYFLYKKNYLWFLFNVIVAFLAFKRIVLLGIIVCAILYLIPRKYRIIFLNPFLITGVIVLGVIFQIQLATGTYDDLIFETFNVSTNQLLMGRQEIWIRALDYANFDYLKYILSGLGHGVLTGFLEGSYRAKNVLMHSDFLSLTLEHGFVFIILFSFLMHYQKSHYQRALALYLTILFASDNVLIYQHVMIPYLLLMMMGAKCTIKAPPEK